MRIKIDIDYNGIVFFDPLTVRDVDNSLETGTNLLERYTTTDAGDEVLRKGAFVPILAIDAGTYVLEIINGDLPDELEKYDTVLNADYALKVTERAYVSDLDTLMDWNGRPHKCIKLDLVPGFYKVSVVGFRKCSSDELIEAGYKVYFCRVETLPNITADTGKNMRVNYPFGDSSED